MASVVKSRNRGEEGPIVWNTDSGYREDKNMPPLRQKEDACHHTAVTGVYIYVALLT